MGLVPFFVNSLFQNWRWDAAWRRAESGKDPGHAARLGDFWPRLPPGVPGIIKGIKEGASSGLSPQHLGLLPSTGTTMVSWPLHKFGPLFLLSGIPGTLPPHSASPVSADKLQTNHSSGLFLHEAFPDYSHSLQSLKTPPGSH